MKRYLYEEVPYKKGYWKQVVRFPHPRKCVLIHNVHCTNELMMKNLQRYLGESLFYAEKPTIYV